MKWQSIVLGFIGVIVASVGIVYGYQAYLAPIPPTPTRPVNTAAVNARTEVVLAEGEVVAVREAVLSFPVGGRIDSIEVGPGQQVEAGAELVRLLDTSARLRAAQAEAAYRMADAEARRIAAGARNEEIASAEAALAAAQARLQRLQEGATPQEVAQAESAVAVAQAELRRVQAGARPEQIEAAEAQVDRAESVLRLAQSAYDDVAWRPDVGMLPQSLALERATIDYELALAQLEVLQRGPTQEEIAVAQAQVAQAEAALNQVRAQATASELAEAQAAVDQARAQLDLLLTGAREEEIAAAQEAVNQARAAWDEALQAMAEMGLHAPWSGTVGEISVEVGEQVAPGQPIVRLLAGVRIKTTDLSEVDVPLVQVGQRANISVDALRGDRLSGTVIEVAPVATLTRGDITFPVKIELDEPDPRLRWGMKVFVEILVND